MEEVIGTRSRDPRMVRIQGPAYSGPTHTPPRDVEQYREGYTGPVYSGPTHTPPRDVEQYREGYTGPNPTKPVMARGQTRPAHGAYKSLEQQEYIQQLSSNKDCGNTVKENMMKSISDKLKGMGLQEIKRFQENLPETISQVRQSKRLQGFPPEAFKTTGNHVEDGRILFHGDGVHFRK